MKQSEIRRADLTSAFKPDCTKYFNVDMSLQPKRMNQLVERMMKSVGLPDWVRYLNQL